MNNIRNKKKQEKINQHTQPGGTDGITNPKRGDGYGISSQHSQNKRKTSRNKQHSIEPLYQRYGRNRLPDSVKNIAVDQQINEQDDKDKRFHLLIICLPVAKIAKKVDVKKRFLSDKVILLLKTAAERACYQNQA